MADPVVEFAQQLPAADQAPWVPAVYLVLGIALQYVAVSGYARNTGSRFASLYARGGLSRLFVHMFKAPSTALHELAHAVMCQLTGTAMGEVVLWRPRLQSDGSVVFGYVMHAPARAWKGALVALAPGILIPPALALLSWAMMGDPLPGGDDIQSRPLWITVLWALALLILTTGAFPSSGDFKLMGFTQWLSLGALTGLAVGLVVIAGGWLALIGALASIVQLLVPATVVGLIWYAATARR
jgi:hypothetical protein